MKSRTLVAAALLSLASTATFAQQVEHKPYVFGMLGIGTIDIDKSGNDQALIAAGATGLSSSVNDSAAAISLGAGYKFTPNIALEVGYLQTADYEYKATFTTGTATEKISGSGVGLSVVGYLPMSANADLFGKIGMWHFSVDDKVQINAVGSASASASSSNTTPAVGLGVDIHLGATGAADLRLEFDHFSKIGDDTTIGSSKLNLVSLGVKVNF